MNEMTRTPHLAHNEATGPADIAVFSKDRRLILIMEVKDGGREMTAQYAAALRHNWIGHGNLPVTPFFMIATRFHIFLWRGEAELGALPSYSATTTPIVTAYCPTITRMRRWRVCGGLDFAMFFWLADIMDERRPLSADSDTDRVLLDSGLFDEIKGGKLDLDVLL
jgi:hypothetical protein